METHENIKLLRESQGLSQEALAEKVGYKDRSSIAKIESGVVDLSQSKIAAFAKALNVTPAQLMGISDEPSRSLPSNILPMPKLVKKPRLGTIACGKPILAVEEAEEFDTVPEDIPCDFTLRCKGDSMINARIYDGDIVYIREQKEVENGEIAAVRIGDEATLKKVYYNGQRIILRACNPLFPDIEYEGEDLNDITILGKAIAFTSVIRHTL